MCLTPDVFCIACINLITSLDSIQDVFLCPSFVGHHSFIPSLYFSLVTLVFLSLDYHLHWVIDLYAWLQNLSSDILPALWAFLLPYQAFNDALMAEWVTTYCYPTAYNVIHANRTCQSFHFLHGTIRCFLLSWDVLLQFVQQLLLLWDFRNCHGCLNLLNLFFHFRDVFF